ncbi:hypothetical protein F5Y04DRAFT_291724 [Hypomontagnella monticulosa]|nr:hypothetical protein F5Y04DRAFT_291724 [Hypomontagnella monticulosa]
MALATKPAIYYSLKSWSRGYSPVTRDIRGQLARGCYGRPPTFPLTISPFNRLVGVRRNHRRHDGAPVICGGGGGDRARSWSGDCSSCPTVFAVPGVPGHQTNPSLEDLRAAYRNARKQVDDGGGAKKKPRFDCAICHKERDSRKIKRHLSTYVKECVLYKHTFADYNELGRRIFSVHVEDTQDGSNLDEINEEVDYDTYYTQAEQDNGTGTTENTQDNDLTFEDEVTQQAPI